MNIALFITSVSNSGGIERVSLWLANELAEAGHQVYMISRVNGIPFFKMSPRIKFLYMAEHEENLYLNYCKYMYKVYVLIRKYRIDRWIDVGINMSLISIPVKLFTGIKIYSWSHFAMSYNWNPVTPRIARLMACRFSEKVIVLTESDKACFQTCYRSSNIVCIPNPITIGTVRRRSENSKTIIAIGRLAYQKGYDMMLEIWRKAQCRDAGWKLHIYGGGPQRTTLTQMIIRMRLTDSVRIFSPSVEIEKVYQEADFLIMTSRFEGLPLVLIEAASAGLPIVCFDCESGPKDVVDDSRNGYLVKCFDLDDFASKIDLLCMNPSLRTAMSEYAVAKSRSFDKSTISQQWISMLGES